MGESSGVSQSQPSCEPRSGAAAIGRDELEDACGEVKGSKCESKNTSAVGRVSPWKRSDDKYRMNSVGRVSSR